MSKKKDAELGLDRPIARRDFLQGAAIGATLGAGLAPVPANALDAEKLAQNAPGYYPPARMGMRGSHPGSFEAAHAVRDGEFWTNAHAIVDTAEHYDLVVVGGGISGLSAAYFYKQALPQAKILILENHDDFGGHAKRNEFHIAGQMLLLNGGTQDIDSPTPYSVVAAGLLQKLGVDPVALANVCDDPAIYDARRLGHAVFFDKETFGVDSLVHAPDPDRAAQMSELETFLSNAPLSPTARRDILRIETGMDDYFPGLSSDEKKDRLSRLSYEDYLLKAVRADRGVIPFYRHRTDDLWGCGIDAVSAIDCWGVGMPGFQGLKLAHGATRRMGYTPAGYAVTGGSPVFHFPDGNASIARLLVRALIPDALPGTSATDVVTAQARYDMLDRPDSLVRIRLNSIVVRARNAASRRNVDIAYAEASGAASIRKVRAKHCILASWNMMIPYLCPEMPEQQKAALHQLVKTPLVYASVALRSWQAFDRLKIKSVYAPGSYFSSFRLNEPVNIGSYRSPASPKNAILIRMLRTPARPGLPEREQHKLGRAELLATPFETFERHIRDQLGRTLASAGFDPAEDVIGVAVNRWPHGYAPEYNALVDGDTTADRTPNLIARARFGNIAIANSDAGMAAYTDSAINQAHRAVYELLNL